MKRPLPPAPFAAAALLLAACQETRHGLPRLPDGGGGGGIGRPRPPRLDGGPSALLDLGRADGGFAPPDLGGPGDGGSDAGGSAPLIQFIDPNPNATAAVPDVIQGNQLRVRVAITPAEGTILDPETVQATYAEGPTVRLFFAAPGEGGATIYDGTIGIGAVVPGGQPQPGCAVDACGTKLTVTAATTTGRSASADSYFIRDVGPFVRFIVPDVEPAYRKNEISFRFTVASLPGLPATDESTVQVTVGDSCYTVVGGVPGCDPRLRKTADFPAPTYDGLINFVTDFDPDLLGEYRLVARARHGAYPPPNDDLDHRAEVVEGQDTLRFIVDLGGPTIRIVEPAEGELIGGVERIVAQIDDDAGVDEESVVAVVGNDLVFQVVEMVEDDEGANRFVGQFDTATLLPSGAGFGPPIGGVPQTIVVFPTITVSAADDLGNEAEAGVVVDLDNAAPVIELDPPPMWAWKEQEGQILCSNPFDPVGDDAVDDVEKVRQAFQVRARVHDLGNPVPGIDLQPVAGTIEDDVQLFLWQDATVPLVVDVDGDCLCDDINPDIDPAAGNPEEVQAVVINLTAVPPSGAPDYYARLCDCDDCSSTACYDTAVDLSCHDCDLPGLYCLPGDEQEPPDEICDEYSPATYMVPTTYGAASIFSIQDLCTPLAVDTLANQFGEGWLCMAVRARDELGNIGVSKPVRVYIDHTCGPRTCDWAGYDASLAPDCRGTLTPDGTVLASPDCGYRSNRATPEIAPGSGEQIPLLEACGPSAPDCPPTDRLCLEDLVGCPIDLVDPACLTDDAGISPRYPDVHHFFFPQVYPRYIIQEQ